MNVSEVIINDLAIQPISQKIGVLKEIFDQLTYSHIPVEKDGVYLGSISENDVRCFDSEKTVEEYRYALSPFFIRKDDALLNILKVFSTNEATLVPVLEEETQAYFGYVELPDILAILEETPFFGEDGNIIVVEKGENDYSFSEISQIIESNDAKIYGIYVSKLSDGIVQVTMKISQSMTNKVLQTFRRYGYEIVSEHEEDNFLQSLKERSDYLNKYLNI